MKKFFTVILIIVSLNAFAQGKASPSPTYTFAGKAGEVSMTWDEFSKSKKELTPIDKGITIKSFHVSVLVINEKDSSYSDYSNQGNMFSGQAIEAMERLHEKKLTNKILIEEVVINKGDKEAKAPGMVIKLH